MNKAEKLCVGVLPLARSTFDVPFAKQVCSDAWELMNSMPVNWVGSSELLFDAEAVEKQILSLNLL